jgi:dTDP-4-amino-4,6-dideoxygalactose transaminase
MIPRFLPGIEIEDILSVLDSKSVDNKFGEISSISGDKRFYLLSSGRSAIYLTLKGLNIGKGDEVIVPALTCPAVLDAIIATHATPVIVPVESERFGLDPFALNKAITTKTKAVIPVDIYGARCRIEEIYEIVNKKCAIIEDSAQASPFAILNWARDYPDALIVSLNYDKQITTGGGGILIIKRPELFNIQDIRDDDNERTDMISSGLLRLLMDKSIYNEFLSMMAGAEIIGNNLIGEDEIINILRIYNRDGYTEGIEVKLRKLSDKYIGKRGKSKIAKLLRKGLWYLIRPVFLSEPGQFKTRKMGILKRSILSLSIKRFKDDIILRKKLAGMLREKITDIRGISFQRTDDGLMRFTISFNDRIVRQNAIKKLAEAGIEAGPFNYPLPVHRIPTYRKYIKIVGDMTWTEMFIEGLINLPVHRQVSVDDINKMAGIIQEVVSGNKGK